MIALRWAARSGSRGMFGFKTVARLSESCFLGGHDSESRGTERRATVSRATDKHFATGLLAALIVGVAAADEITFTPQGQTATRSVDAEVLVEAADGGLMIRLRDGQLLLLQPGQIVARDRRPGR